MKIFARFILINCGIEFDLLWSRYCIMSEISRRSVVPANPPVHAVKATKTTGTEFQINNAKLYVTVVTLSTNNNTTFLQNIKQGFKRTIFWNKHISEITAQPKITIQVI